MKYKAFLSYSHSQDKDFSPILQRSLETFAKKWHQVRRIKIFRDETNLTATPSLWSSIEVALQNSEYFIYLASPEAAKSKWVIQEIQWWLDNKEKKKLLILLTDGIAQWNNLFNKFDEQSNAIPKNLIDQFRDEPLYIDFRWAKDPKINISSDNPRFQNEVATLASTLFEEEKDELVGYNAKQIKTRKIFLQTVSLGLISLLIISLIATYFAIINRNEATQKVFELRDNLAKSYEQNALFSIARGDSTQDNSLRLKEYRKAWLYTLEANKLILPELIKTITQSSRGEIFNLSPLLVNRSTLIDPVTNVGGSIFSIAYSPIDASFALGVNQGIQLWDIKTGKIIHTLKGHTDVVASLVYSPDGKTLATASYDQTIRLWDVVTGKLKKILKGHIGRVRALTYSPDGKTLASGSEDQTVRFWDARTGQLKGILEGHEYWVMSLDYSPDGKVLAVGSDKKIHLWNVATKQRKKIMATGHANGVLSLKYSPNGKILASSSYEKVIQLWDAETGTIKHILKGHEEQVWGLVYSPDGKTLASASFDKTVRLWGAKTGQLKKIIRGHTGRIMALGYSTDGEILISGSLDSTIRLWDAVTGKSKQVSNKPIFANEISPSSPNKNFKLKQTIIEPKLIQGISYSPDGKYLASASADKNIRIWDSRTLSLVKILTGHSKTVFGVTYSPDGRILASTSEDGSIRIWDAETFTLRKLIKSNSWLLTFSPDGKTFAIEIGSMIEIWDAKTFDRIKTIKGHQGNIWALTYSLDSQTVASAGEDQIIRLWDINTGKIKQELKGHKHWVRKLTYSPDGKSIASSADDHMVIIWDLITGKIKQNLKGHKDSIWALSYSSDGKILTSGSFDKTIRFWDIKTGKTKQVLKGHARFIRALAYSPDGKTLASASDDGIIHFWNLNTLKLFRDFDPEKTLNLLKFLWKMDLDEDTLEYIDKARAPSLYPLEGYFYTDKKYFPLLTVPTEGKTKMDLLVQFLEKNCAYKDKDQAEACNK